MNNWLSSLIIFGFPVISFAIAIPVFFGIGKNNQPEKETAHLLKKKLTAGLVFLPAALLIVSTIKYSIGIGGKMLIGIAIGAVLVSVLLFIFIKRAKFSDLSFFAFSFGAYSLAIAGGVYAGNVISGTSGSMEFPLLIGSIAALAYILGIFISLASLGGKTTKAICRGIAGSLLVSLAGFYIVSKATFGAGYFRIFLASLFGLLAADAISILVSFFVERKIKIAWIVLSSAAVLALAVFGGYQLSGIYGASISLVSAVSLSGFIFSQIRPSPELESKIEL